MTIPNKASDEQIALLRDLARRYANGKPRDALTAVLDDHARLSKELERYRRAFESAYTVQYEFVSPLDGSTRVWRDSPNTWNGQSPRSARKLYAAPRAEQTDLCVSQIAESETQQSLSSTDETQPQPVPPAASGVASDTEILDWIEEHASSSGGGHGFTLSVFVPVDSECLRGAIQQAIGQSKIIPTNLPMD